MVPFAQQHGDLLNSGRNLAARLRGGQYLVHIGESDRFRRVGLLGVRRNRVEILLDVRVNLVERIDFGTVRRVRTALIGIGERGSYHAIFDGRPRCQENVVLVHAHYVRSFSLQNADDFKRHIPDADFSADGRLPAEQLAYDCLAYHAYFTGVANIMFGECFTPVEIGPLAYLQKRRGGAIDVGRHPVAVAIHYLRAGAHNRRYVPDGGALFADRIRILRRQRSPAA